jgi:heparan-alpha-glucosaminide N-acetyltransferase
MSSNQTTPKSAEVAKRGRLVSIDAYRGMVMFLMLAEMMHLHSLSESFPGNRFLSWLRFHTQHVAWEGMSLHDLIQPGFTFLVGVAMPFSIASRLRRGDSKTRLLLHAAWRAVVLMIIGIVLRSLDQDQTNFTFEDTLTQIGLGYFFVFLIALSPRWVHYVSAFLILALFWLAFAFSPAPSPDFDYEAVGVAAEWPNHHEGFASRWNMNSNLSWRFDTWFLNLFPRKEVFTFNDGGYATLSFIPTMATMLFGLIAGVWLKLDLTARERAVRFLAAIAVGLLLGYALAWTDLCPLVKRIWTPSFALASGGYCMAWLFALHLICDVKGFSNVFFPFVVIGANSIFIYVASWTIAEPIRAMLLRHFGEAPFSVLGSEFVTQLSGAATILVLFWVLLWMYHRKLFIKV